MVHVGDIGSSAPDEACGDAWLDARKRQFSRIRHRFIIIPGDNEWSDCRNPAERLKKWRAIFCPAPGEYCEHRRWEAGGWVFATLNVPGNKVATLQDDPQALKNREDFIRRTITRGKANPAPQYSMPAWGQSEGGPFNPEQVTQLVNFIMRGTEEDWAEIVHIRTHLEGVLNDHADPGAPPAPLSGADLAQQYCTACHSFDANRPSVIPDAPNLARYGVEGPLNDQLKALRDSGDQDWLFKWVANAQKIKPGVIMPPWLDTEGAPQPLNEAAVRLLVTYLEGLGK